MTYQWIFTSELHQGKNYPNPFLKGAATNMLLLALSLQIYFQKINHQIMMTFILTLFETKASNL